MGHLQLNLIVFACVYNTSICQWQQHVLVCGGVFHLNWVFTFGFSALYEVHQDSSIGFSKYWVKYWSCNFWKCFSTAKRLFFSLEEAWELFLFQYLFFYKHGSHRSNLRTCKVLNALVVALERPEGPDSCIHYQ